MSEVPSAINFSHQSDEHAFVLNSLKEIQTIAAMAASGVVVDVKAMARVILRITDELIENSDDITDKLDS
jgi:hypothetical protein